MTAFKDIGLIETLILISTFCVGWFIIIQEGMLLEDLGKKISKLPKLIRKPLGDCVPCAASIVGGVCYFLLSSIPYGYVLVLIVSAVAVNSIVYNIIMYLSNRAEEAGLMAEIRNKQIIQMGGKKNCSNCKKQEDVKENSN